MRFDLACVSSLLLASAALADPRHYHKRSQLLGRADATQPNYTNDKAGVAVALDGNFAFATTEFTVPSLSGPAGSIGISLLVGGCDNVNLAAVIGCSWDGHKANYAAVGGISGPDTKHTDLEAFKDIEITAGQRIKVALHPSSDNSVSLYFKNINTGKHQRKNLPLPGAKNFCVGFGGWNLETLDAPLPGFSEVAFHDATITTSHGRSSIGDAVVTMEIKQNNKVLTHTWFRGTSGNIKHLK